MGCDCGAEGSLWVKRATFIMSSNWWLRLWCLTRLGRCCSLMDTRYQLQTRDLLSNGTLTLDLMGNLHCQRAFSDKLFQSSKFSTNLQEVSTALKRKSENIEHMFKWHSPLVQKIKATTQKHLNSAVFHYHSAVAFSQFQLFPHFQPSAISHQICENKTTIGAACSWPSAEAKRIMHRDRTSQNVAASV